MGTVCTQPPPDRPTDRRRRRGRIVRAQQVPVGVGEGRHDDDGGGGGVAICVPPPPTFPDTDTPVSNRSVSSDDGRIVIINLTHLIGKYYKI